MRYDIAFQRILKQTGITKAELARRAGYTPAHVSQLLSGARHPSTESIERIGLALEVPPELVALFGAEPGELREGITPAVAAELAKHMLSALMAKPGRKKGRVAR